MEVSQSNSIKLLRLPMYASNPILEFPPPSHSSLHNSVHHADASETRILLIEQRCFVVFLPVSTHLLEIRSNA